MTKAVAVATRLARAVVVEVVDPEGSFILAVTPAGIVVDYPTAAMQVEFDDTLLPVQGQCRNCTTPRSIAAATCALCGVRSPTAADADLRLQASLSWRLG